MASLELLGQNRPAAFASFLGIEPPRQTFVSGDRRTLADGRQVLDAIATEHQSRHDAGDGFQSGGIY